MKDHPAVRQLPKTVDEVADLLIADLLISNLSALSSFNEAQFHRLYNSVAKYILEEFQVWTGNHALLASCFAMSGRYHRHLDPAMIILRRVQEKLRYARGAGTTH